MFRGVTTLNLDVKGRLAVPAKHRDALLERADGKLVVTADPAKCLLLYPLPEWEPIQEQIMNMPSLNSQVRNLQRLIVGYAEDVEMDATGRILISGPLREFAGLSKRLVLVGQGRKFELWDEECWIAQRDAALAIPQGGGWPSELGSFAL
ncbi:MAG: division/cell wall cluster transcriptional repressor MraZ [Pseudomonadota bacterium]|nr:division/cell wall cluster transcriptional repressor MraZ [Pseudomonadota bacterium]